MKKNEKNWANWNLELKKRKITPSLNETYKLFCKNKDLNIVAKEKGVQIETIQRQIIELITQSYIDVNDIVNNRDKKEQILISINKNGIESLSKIKENLPKEITWFEIKCIIADINSKPKKI